MLRLKRVFQVRTDAERTAAELARASASRGTTIPTTPPVPRQPSSIANSDTLEHSDAPNDDDDMTGGGTAGLAGQRASRSQSINDSFRVMAEQQSQLVDEDDTDREPVRQSPIGVIPIPTLFDFNRSHWVDMHARAAIRSFDEELQLYEMLDLDAEGEEDVGVDVDNDTGDLLMN